jgi:hypothetical protein
MVCWRNFNVHVHAQCLWPCPYLCPNPCLCSCPWGCPCPCLAVSVSVQMCLHMFPYSCVCSCLEFHDHFQFYVTFHFWVHIHFYATCAGFHAVCKCSTDKQREHVAWIFNIDMQHGWMQHGHEERINSMDMDENWHSHTALSWTMQHQHWHTA